MELLSVKEPVFRSVDDSVQSIVPSRLSCYSDEASSIRSSGSHELLYIPFAFENQLFTSYVYKRNFRIPQIRQLRQMVKFGGPGHDINPASATLEDLGVKGSLQAIKTADEYGHFPSQASEVFSTTVDPRIDEISDDVNASIQGSARSPDGASRPENAQLEHNTNEGATLAIAGSSSAVLLDKYDPSHNDGPSLPLRKLGKGRWPTSSECSIPIPESELLNTVHKASLALLSRTDNEFSACDCHFRAPDSGGTKLLSSLFLRLWQGDSMTTYNFVRRVGVGDPLLPLVCSQCSLTISDMVLMFQGLLEQDNVFFNTVMQTIAFTYGSHSTSKLVDDLVSSDNRSMEMNDTSIQEIAITKVHWTGKILNDPQITFAAAYREEAASNVTLHYFPTTLQLACITKKPNVVEYLLFMGRPTISLDWTSNPFILATKTRCKPILELFIKRASTMVTKTIKNLALIMVVNQDCVVSDGWTDPNQNDRKRCDEDADIVSLPLSYGASPN